jgi:hypothetical protein
MASEVPATECDRQLGGDERISIALAYLFQAVQYAREADCDAWHFAVEISVLEGFGLSVNDFRWLVSKGYVKQAAELTAEGDRCRTFGPEGGLHFSPRSCFVLTEQGARHIQSILPQAATVGQIPLTTGNGSSGDSSAIPSNGSQPFDRAATPTPHWNARLRELRVGARLVKRFRVPSPNQEIILTAFQEEGWPELIDDPLPPETGQDSKRRVHDTIKNLNHHQENHLLHFHGDGTGKGIRWDFVAESGVRELR